MVVAFGDDFGGSARGKSTKATSRTWFVLRRLPSWYHSSSMSEVGGARVKTAQKAERRNLSSPPPPRRSLKTSAACANAAAATRHSVAVVARGPRDRTSVRAALGAASCWRHHGACGAQRNPAFAMRVSSKVEAAASRAWWLAGGELSRLGRRPALVSSALAAASTRKATVLTLPAGYAHADGALAQARGRISSRRPDGQRR
jgi:hypothetical protein